MIAAVVARDPRIGIGRRCRRPEPRAAQTEIRHELEPLAEQDRALGLDRRVEPPRGRRRRDLRSGADIDAQVDAARQPIEIADEPQPSRRLDLAGVPDSLLEASSDLGAKPGRTLRSVAFPMIIPSLAAGSILLPAIETKVGIQSIDMHACSLTLPALI